MINLSAVQKNLGVIYRRPECGEPLPVHVLIELDTTSRTSARRLMSISMDSPASCDGGHTGHLNWRWTLLLCALTGLHRNY